MIWLVIAIAWWAVGVSSMLWLRRGDVLIWRDLALCIVVGILGPLLWAVIGFVILIQADFWIEPVFKKDRRRKPDGDE